MANKIAILFTGSRYWADAQYVGGFIASLKPTAPIIVHGGARGLDSIVDAAARACGFEVRVYPADWNTHGKVAGFLRNEQMLRQESPSWVVAYTYNLFESSGTRDMVTRALKDRKTVMLNPSTMANRQQVVKMSPQSGQLYIGLD